MKSSNTKKVAKFDKAKGCPVNFFFEEYNGKNVLRSKINDPSIPPTEMMQALQGIAGAQNYDIAMEIIYFGAQATPTTINTEEGLTHKINVSLQAITESAAQDTTEARLAAQAHALYAQGMQYLAKSEHAEPPRAEFQMTAAIKLLRLHNETIEALNRYRRGGEQKVVMQHFNVNDGAKAIIGTIQQGMAQGG